MAQQKSRGINHEEFDSARLFSDTAVAVSAKESNEAFGGWYSYYSLVMEILTVKLKKGPPSGFQISVMLIYFSFMDR
jgi:hypothetical protein